MTLTAPPVTITIAVQWGEMDALGHVNNTRFFAWFESARIALFDRIGLVTEGPSKLGPVLATTSCDFLKPVVYPATVQIRASVSRVGETSIGIDYVVSAAGAGATGTGATGEVFARGTSVVVLVDFKTMKKARVPDELRAALARLPTTA